MITGREFEQKANQVREEVMNAIYDYAYGKIEEILEADESISIYLEKGEIEFPRMPDFLEEVKQNCKSKYKISDKIWCKLEEECEKKLNEELERIGWEVTEEGNLKPKAENPNALPANIID